MRLRTQVNAFTMIELMVAIVIIAILAAITLSIGSAVLESADRRKTQDVLTLLGKAMEEYEQHVGRPMTYGQGDCSCAQCPRLCDSDFSGDCNQSYADQPVPGDRPLDGISRYDIAFLPAIVGLEETEGPYRQVTEAETRQQLGCRVGNSDANKGQGLMVEVIKRLESVDSSRSILARIGPDAWRVVQGVDDPYTCFDTESITTRYLVDAWGQPIIAVFPGRDWDPDWDYLPPTSTGGGPPPSELPDTDGSIRTLEECAFGPARGRTYFMSAGPDQRYGWLNYIDREGAPFVVDSTPDSRYPRTEDNLYSYEVRQW